LKAEDVFQYRISERLNDMDVKSTQLPWESLQHTEGDIPWPALYEFAAAVVADSKTVDELIKLYVQTFDYSCEHICFVNLYVPAIFALAAPQLDDERRREIGVFLVAKLAEAGREDDDLLMEVLMAACGSMGPVILPAVLETIAKEPDHQGAWFYLWGLTELAAKSEDAEIRNRVLQACKNLLEQADNGEIEPLEAIDAAWTVAFMKCSDCRSLLQRLKSKAVKNFCYGDYKEAIELLDGQLDYTPLPNLWEMPVKEWLVRRWQMAKDWYAKQEGSNEEDEIDAGTRRARELTERFLKSSEAAGLSDDLLEDAGFIVYNLLEYAWVHAGSRPEEIQEQTLEQVLLEKFPRKISAERDLFEKIAPVTVALLRWMESEGILADTTSLVEAVHGWADAIVANGMNPKYWGMGKSFMMQARADGIDTENQQALQLYMAEYNLRQLKAKHSGDSAAPRDFSPNIPIVQHSSKIGRNEPCPCGSGKKYKKCCGSVDKLTTSL
jgi:uncharacterized protein YchJ